MPSQYVDFPDPGGPITSCANGIFHEILMMLLLRSVTIMKKVRWLVTQVRVKHEPFYKDSSYLLSWHQRLTRAITINPINSNSFLSNFS